MSYLLLWCLETRADVKEVLEVLAFGKELIRRLVDCWQTPPLLSFLPLIDVPSSDAANRAQSRCGAHGRGLQ